MKNGFRLTHVHLFISGLVLFSGFTLPAVAQPVLSSIEKEDIRYTAGDGKVQITKSINVNGRFINSATIVISAGYNPDEDLLTYDGWRFDSEWDKGRGTLTLSGFGSASDYRSALRDIFYENSNKLNPTTNTRVISFSIASIYGKSNTLSRNILVQTKDVAPVLGNIESDPAVFCINSGSIVVTKSLSVNDNDNINLSSAVITITTGFTVNTDKLIFSDQNGISGNWNGTTGQLTLSGVSSVLNYQAALRSVRYENLNPENPHAGFLELTFRVSDGVLQSNIVTRNIVHPLPTAVIAGEFSICRDNVAGISITFSGSAPWNFSYRNNSGTPVPIQNISANPYVLPVSNEGTYTLVSVNDKYCPGKISGSATVNLLPEPDVRITGLESAYTKQSTEMIPLSGEPVGGIFSGPGVIPYGENWFFLPSLPAPGVHQIVYKYRTNESSCYGYDTASVRIVEKSAAIELENNRTNFCVNDLPFKVTGINLLDNSPGYFSITGGKGLIDHGNNTATIYPDSLQINQYTITYTAPDGNPASQIIEIGNPLIADFKWSAECFDPNDPVEFTNTSTSTFGFLTSDSYHWSISTGTDERKFTTRDITYNFPDVGNYEVTLHLRNSYGCVNETSKVFPLRPVFALAGNNYSEDFEGEQYWESGYDQDAGLNSWQLGKPDQVINGFSEPYSGENCWFTNITMNPVPREESWITSPCFDFTGTEKPTLVARIRRSFTDTRDGANINYTVDNGAHWNLIGTLNDGIHWFNGYFGNPGAQSQGWTAVTDNDWVETRHILDFLNDERVVQFRLNFNASGSAFGNKGIAVDDIKIVERNRTILIEHFTNISQMAAAADELLDKTAQSAGTGLIDLQYHTADPDDPFYSQNPVISNTRQFYYGLTSVPYSIINGGTQSIQHIDYVNNILSPAQISIESLYDSDFDLKVTSMPDGDQLFVETVITALHDVPISELSVRLAVIEPLIVDSEVTGEDSVFRNVVRAMLPDAAGKSIYRSWQKGDEYRIVEWWDIGDVFNRDGLRVAAFIQNEMTREIEQASLDERGLINDTDDPIEASGPQFTIFPNPSNNFLTIIFASETNNYSLIELINNLGESVYAQKVKNIMRHTLNVSHMPEGMYILRIVGEDGQSENLKIIINH